jgi:hypothetical protein
MQDEGHIHVGRALEQFEGICMVVAGPQPPASSPGPRAPFANRECAGALLTDYMGSLQGCKSAQLVSGW